MKKVNYFQRFLMYIIMVPVELIILPLTIIHFVNVRANKRALKLDNKVEVLVKAKRR